mmetsp:Transcript_8986/g.33885  ORF Transcript_8986/g.33885 Transcript_8986/m.33885 type:complete len:300 (-) Transcript_8986:171-1070(-)
MVGQVAALRLRVGEVQREQIGVGSLLRFSTGSRQLLPPPSHHRVCVVVHDSQGREESSPGRQEPAPQPPERHEEVHVAVLLNVVEGRRHGVVRTAQRVDVLAKGDVPDGVNREAMQDVVKVDAVLLRLPRDPSAGRDAPAQQEEEAGRVEDLLGRFGVGNVAAVHHLLQQLHHGIAAGVDGGHHVVPEGLDLEHVGRHFAVDPPAVAVHVEDAIPQEGLEARGHGAALAVLLELRLQDMLDVLGVSREEQARLRPDFHAPGLGREGASVLVEIIQEAMHIGQEVNGGVEEPVLRRSDVS